MLQITIKIRDEKKEWKEPNTITALTMTKVYDNSLDGISLEYIDESEIPLPLMSLISTQIDGVELFWNSISDVIAKTGKFYRHQVRAIELIGSLQFVTTEAMKIPLASSLERAKRPRYFYTDGSSDNAMDFDKNGNYTILGVLRKVLKTNVDLFYNKYTFQEIGANITAPEFQFERNNLLEVINSIYEYLGEQPCITYDKGEEKFHIEPKRIVEEEIDLSTKKIIDFSRGTDINNFGEQIESYIDSVITNTSWKGWSNKQGLEYPESEDKLTDKNSYFTIPYPIRSIKQINIKVELAISFSYGWPTSSYPGTDIRDIFFSVPFIETELWKMLPEKDKKLIAYYSSKDDKIYNVYSACINSEDAQNYTDKSKQGYKDLHSYYISKYNIHGEQDAIYNTANFNIGILLENVFIGDIQYEPIYSEHLRDEKRSFESNIDGFNPTINYQLSLGANDFKQTRKALSSRVEKMNVPEIKVAEIAANYLSAFKVGSIITIDGIKYKANNVEYVFKSNRCYATAVFSKGTYRISPYSYAAKNAPKFDDYSSNNIIRHINYTEYIEFSFTNKTRSAYSKMKATTSPFKSILPGQSYNPVRLGTIISDSVPNGSEKINTSIALIFNADQLGFNYTFVCKDGRFAPLKYNDVQKRYISVPYTYYWAETDSKGNEIGFLASGFLNDAIFNFGIWSKGFKLNKTPAETLGLTYQNLFYVDPSLANDAVIVYETIYQSESVLSGNRKIFISASETYSQDDTTGKGNEENISESNIQLIDDGGSIKLTISGFNLSNAKSWAITTDDNKLLIAINSNTPYVYFNFIGRGS